MADFENESRFAYYRIFSVGNKDSRYKLTVGEYEGNAGKQLSDLLSFFFYLTDDAEKTPNIYYSEHPFNKQIDFFQEIRWKHTMDNHFTQVTKTRIIVPVDLKVDGGITSATGPTSMDCT